MMHDHTVCPRSYYRIVSAQMFPQILWRFPLAYVVCKHCIPFVLLAYGLAMISPISAEESLRATD